MTPEEVQAHKNWRDTMAHQPTPAEGCFHANYPDTTWQADTCTTLPPRVYSNPHPRNTRMRTIQAVGNGGDYVLSSATLISKTVGSFPKVSGVTSERGLNGSGGLGPDEYSLQINSNDDATTSACADRSDCTVWQQFIYDNGGSEKQAGLFMQYWLQNYGSDCPSGWVSDGNVSCYRNSNAVVLPSVPATHLANLKLTGSANANGLDTVTFTNGNTAHSVSASDNAVNIATVWTDSEFNVFGNSNSSRANFNRGSSITVKVAAFNGDTAAPTCTENWRDTMAHQPTPAEGCFHANYPDTTWQADTCTTLPPRVYSNPHPRNTRMRTIQAVGNGGDYVLSSATLISKTVGSFPKVSGVTSERGLNGSGGLGPDEYSLQINSNDDATTSACADRSDCTVWQQFIYDNGGSEKQAGLFMQYWLQNYGSDCPSGWVSDGNVSCYRNSNAVVLPSVPATHLANLKLTGSANANGLDTVTFTNGNTAHSVSASDNAVNIATVWTDSEFNVFGNSNSSRANFNRGSSITVKVAAFNGDTAAPTCTAGGTTAETNNLYLGNCYATGGNMPSITFTEAN